MNTVHEFQFSSKQGSTSSALPKDFGNGTSGEQTDSKPAEDTVPEDITNFYDKMDKEDEDDEEEAVLKTVSFEVNQVSCFCLPHVSCLCVASVKKIHGLSPQANYTVKAPPFVGEVSANFCR
jgi:hypothetical protein